MNALFSTRKLPRLLAIGPWIGCLALLASACSTVRYNSFVEPLGGHDAEGPGDQLYFHTAYCEGHPSRLASLILPASWSERKRLDSVGDGVRRLDPPIEARWEHGDSIVPAARLEFFGPGEGPGFYALREPSEGQPFPRWTHGDIGVLTPEEIDAEALELLRAGRNAYRVVSLDPEARLAPYRILGAVSEREGNVEWIELAVLEFEDSRGPMKRFGHTVLRSGTHVIYGTVVVAAVAGGLWLTVLFVDWVGDHPF